MPRLEITPEIGAVNTVSAIADFAMSSCDLAIAVYEVQKIVRRLRERGLGILITDHNVRETLKLVDRGYIIHKGEDPGTN